MKYTGQETNEVKLPFKKRGNSSHNKPANSLFYLSPIQGQKQNSQQVSSCVKRNSRKTPAKSPQVLTPPDTPSAINLDDGKLKNG